MELRHVRHFRYGSGGHPPSLRIDALAWLEAGTGRHGRANFRELLLGCIETKFCKQILVGKLSPRSTQCTPLHRSLISKFSLKIADFFCCFFPKISQMLPGFCLFFAKFNKKNSGFFQNAACSFKKNVQYFSWNFIEILPIFSEKSGIFGTRNCKISDSVNHIPSVL